MTDSANTSTKKAERRYRLYFRLMDFSFLAALVIISNVVLDYAFGIDTLPADKPWAGFIGIPSIIGVSLIPGFLIVAKFMRDEYAELLWRRTGVIVIYLLAFTPYVYMISNWITYWILRSEKAPFPYNITVPETHLHTVMAYVSIYVMIVFVCVFQFLRWKDSR